jgi:AraC-like DNA-binding protein
VLQDLPPMSDLLPCIATSVASRRVLWWSREVIRVVEELCRPVAHTLSVGEISRRVGISRSRLTQRFRKEVGLAVHQYLCRVGIRLASLLLRHTDAKLAAIAFHAGFYDASHLSRVFYRYTGSRPGAFRRDERDATLRGGRDNCGRVAEAGRLEASSGRMNRRRRRSTKLQRASEIAARP